MAGHHPYPPHPPAPPRRRGFPWLAVLGAAGLVLILVVGITVVLVGRDDDAPPDRRSRAEELRERLLEDARAELPTIAAVENEVPGYDHTTVVTGVGTDAELTIPASYDADVADPWQGAAGKIEVYADAALTRPVPVEILPDVASPSSDPHLAITPIKLRRTHITREDGQATGTLADLGTFWNLNPTVFVVQYLTPDGAQRPRPLVTEVHFEAETPAPTQISSEITGQGDAVLRWSRVPEASEYLVVLQQRRGTLTDTVRVVGRTTETTWSTAATERCLRSSCRQNEMLMLTTVDASTMLGLPHLVAEKVDARLGVIAVVDRQASAMTPIDFGGLEVLPVRSDRKWDAGADIAGRGVAALPSRFLFVSVDGSTRATGAFVDRAEVRRRGPDWVVPLRGQGTRLVDPVRIPAAAVDDIDAAVATFNERAQRDYPPAGLRETGIVIRTDLPQQPSPELPPPDYPVFGSNELTRFIAGQLIAGSTAIDISEFLDQPGMPDYADALHEAVYQNPYAMAYFDQFSFDGTVIHVEAAYPPAEKQARQAKIADAAEAVVDSQISAGMSVSEKVSAINRYLVDHADYDDAAIAASGKYRSDIPADYRYAWETDGTLVNALGVCMSYAYAFHAVAEEAGLESVVVSGELADGGGHAWNKVKIGDSWRAVDVTWNDPGGAWAASSGTRYLMIRDGEFTGSALRTERDTWMADAYLSQYATR